MLIPADWLARSYAGSSKELEIGRKVLYIAVWPYMMHQNGEDSNNSNTLHTLRG